MSNKQKILDNHSTKFVRTDEKTSVLLADGSWGLENKIEREWDRIAVLAAMGMSPKDIAVSEGMSISALTAKYGDALLVGKAKANSMVMQTFYLLAVSGRSPSTTALYLKNKLGWAEKTEQTTVSTTEQDAKRLKEMQSIVSKEDRLKEVEGILEKCNIPNTTIN